MATDLYEIICRYSGPTCIYRFGSVQLKIVYAFEICPHFCICYSNLTLTQACHTNCNRYSIAISCRTVFIRFVQRLHCYLHRGRLSNLRSKHKSGAIARSYRYHVFVFSCFAFGGVTTAYFVIVGCFIFHFDHCCPIDHPPAIAQTKQLDSFLKLIACVLQHRRIPQIQMNT